MKRIRFELGLARGRKVTQAEFAQLVSEVLRLDPPLTMMAAHGWEQGAEPGFMAGCAIAHLGGLPAEALAFKQSGGASRPSTASLVAPASAPNRRVAERPSFPPLKGHPIVSSSAKNKKKGA